MANTRVFNSLGIVASDAQEVTEDGPRTVGDSYRKTNLTDLQQVAGENYDVNPRTEDLNQKLFNQSSFTDLLDSKGSLGWTELVDYTPPALVWATDGTPGNGDYYICLRENGPNSVDNYVIDPISDDQDNPQYWGIFENSAQLRLDLTDETPGDEGSRLVGHNYTDVNGGVDEGLTVKTAIDNAFLALQGIQGLDVLAFASVFVETDRVTPPTISSSSVFSAYNLESGNIAPLPELDGGALPTDFLQGLRLTYTTPIPTPYNVQVFAQIGSALFVELQTGVGSYVSYDNLLAGSMDVYYKYYPNQPATQFSVQLTTFSFICYRYNP